MKRKDIKALHTKNGVELQKDLLTKQAELKKLIVEKGTTRLKNTRVIRNLKDDLARIYTVLRLYKNKETKK